MKLLHALIWVTFLFLGFGAQAKTIYVAEKATGSNNGNSWNNAYNDLQAALLAAKSGDELWVAEGVYIPGATAKSIFELKSGVSLYGGFFGNEKSREERDWKQYKTVLSGEIGDANSLTDNIAQILHADGINGAVFLDGFEVSKGYSIGFMAGGLVIEDCSPTIQNCVFVDNHAQGGFSSGGAVTLTGFDAPASPEFVNCIFKDNTCSVIGGAVHSNNADNKPVFKGCLFEHNKALRGAAIHNGGGDVFTYNCTFIKNEADKGAASYTSSGNSTNHVNAIVWNNNSTESSTDITNNSSKATTTAAYSIIEGGFSGTGNISADPQFVSGLTYGLKSSSPGKNAADQSVVTLLPEIDLDGNRRVTYRKLDIGAYEVVCEASNTSKASIVESSCGPYEAPSGQVFTASGTYLDVVANYNGCDSLITIELTINSNDTSFSVTSCLSYQLNDKTYDKTGVYTQVLSNSKGCDSTVNVDLTIKQVNTNVAQAGGTLESDANGAMYQWIDCADHSAIDGAIAQQFTPTEDGDYAVVLTEDGCTDTSECITMTPSGVHQLGSNSLRIYPNPVKDYLQLEFSGEEPKLVTLSDVSGKQWSFGYCENGALLKVDFLEAGVYSLRVGDCRPQQLIKLD